MIDRACSSNRSVSLSALASRVIDVAVILAKGLIVVVVAVAALGLTSCIAAGAPEPTNSGVEVNQHFAAFEVCDDLPAPFLCARSRCR